MASPANLNRIWLDNGDTMQKWDKQFQSTQSGEIFYNYQACIGGRCSNRKFVVWVVFDMHYSFYLILAVVCLLIYNNFNNIIDHPTSSPNSYQALRLFTNLHYCIYMLPSSAKKHSTEQTAFKLETLFLLKSATRLASATAFFPTAIVNLTELSWLHYSRSVLESLI